MSAALEASSTLGAPFEVVAETVVAIETPAVTFEVGDKVRIADSARTAFDGHVDPRAFGQIGELVSGPYSEGWEVSYDTTTTYSGPRTDTNYIGPDYLTKLTEVDLLREELAKVTVERDAAQESSTGARDLLNRQAAEFEAWKANLQEVALTAAIDNDMCGVFDRVMEKVGLEGREREFTFRVNLDSYVYVSVTATSMANARDGINESVIRDRINERTYNLSIDDWSIDEDD